MGYLILISLLSFFGWAGPSVSLVTDQFVSSLKSSEENNFQAIDLSADFAYGQEIRLETDIDMSFNLSDENFNNFNPAQFSVSTGPWTIGRKVKNFSHLDDRWNAGLIQPQFGFNPLRKSAQGLTGAFYDYAQQNFQVSLMASGLYIPSQGASVRVEDGQFVASSQWFQAPPATVEFRGVDIPVFYTVETPEIADVVQQNTAVARLGWHHKDRIQISSSFGRKPINQLALGFDGELNIATDRVDASIFPQVVYHNFIAIDASYLLNDFKFDLSYYEDQPDRIDFPQKYTYQIFTPAKIYSPTVSFQRGRLQVALSMFFREGGDEIEIGEFAGSGGGILPGRFEHKNAARVSSTLFGTKWTASAWWTQELDVQSDHIGASFQYLASNQWQLFTGLDLMATQDSSSTDVISRYQASDRFYGGVRYAF